MLLGSSIKKSLFTSIAFLMSVLLSAQTTGDCCSATFIPSIPNDSMLIPVSIHPGNPKCFLFRGKPMAFLTAEHYGAVMNRPFRFERYLADAASKGIAYTRLFLFFRELQSAQNPYSTCKPESPDYISPLIILSTWQTKES